MKEVGFKEEEFLEAARQACFSGERTIVRIGDIEAALVPCEDMELLEELEV